MREEQVQKEGCRERSSFFLGGIHADTCHLVREHGTTNLMINQDGNGITMRKTAG
jgi:hypothetical protein